MERRAFVQKAARVSLFAGLAAIAGIVIGKRKLTVAPCHQGDACKKCVEYGFCSKDQALKQRAHERKEKA